MKIHDKFYLVTILTTLVTRIIVYFNPVPSPTVSGFRLHHWMYGAAGVLVCLLIRRRYKNPLLLGAAMGVFLDEVGYILINGKTHEDNYSPLSFILIMVFEVILFVYRKTIMDLYMKESKRRSK